MGSVGFPGASHTGCAGVPAGILLAWLLATPLTAQPPSAAADAPAELIAGIEAPREPGSSDDAGRSLAELLETHGISALSVAVVEDYRLHWARAYGVADESTGAPADTETLFQAASISKPVSAMAVLRAVQDGLFDLDDDINSILRSWQLRDDAKLLAETPVTPRMLLSMTAGTTVSGFPGYKPDAELPTVPEVLGRKDEETPANTDPVVVGWQPGTRYEYSGGGSTILQLALSDAMAKPFDQILQETVLDPLGMTRSCFCQPLPAALHGNAARAGGSTTGSAAKGRKPRAPWHVYPELYAAGLWTTPTDLAKFLIEVQLSLEGRSNRILTPESTRKMVTPGGVGHYALGFTTGAETPHRPAPPGEADRFFGHTGGNWGFRGNFVGSLEGGNGYVILATGSVANPVIFVELPTRIRAAYGWD
ncbi:MAG: serine hydrolase [Acidobacteriota bacterium]|nr:serine hydrolase [Acidobacteriota bacterium]